MELFTITSDLNNLFSAINTTTNYFITWILFTNNRIFEYMSSEKSLMKVGTKIKTGRFPNTNIKKCFNYM